MVDFHINSISDSSERLLEKICSSSEFTQDSLKIFRNITEIHANCGVISDASSAVYDESSLRNLSENLNIASKASITDTVGSIEELLALSRVLAHAVFVAPKDRPVIPSTIGRSAFIKDKRLE